MVTNGWKRRHAVSGEDLVSLGLAVKSQTGRIRLHMRRDFIADSPSAVAHNPAYTRQTLRPREDYQKPAVQQPTANFSHGFTAQEVLNAAVQYCREHKCHSWWESSLPECDLGSVICATSYKLGETGDLKRHLETDFPAVQFLKRAGYLATLRP